MIIMIILIAILTIGIMLWLFAEDDAQFVGILITVLVGFVMFFCIVGIISTQYEDKIEHQNMLAEKEVLEYRIENSQDITGNELLYKDIVDFNNRIRTAHTNANNPWISWFCGQKVGTIEYIEIPELKIGENENEN